MRFRGLLAARGVHGLVTRFGSKSMRRLAFDEKYRQGDWKFSGEGGGELGMVVRRYLRNGDLLLMGCGGASVLDGLESDGINSGLGIDLSGEAVRIASRYSSGKIKFEQADMIEFVAPRRYDVILFSESIYYVPKRQQDSLLLKLAKDLKLGGVLVVTISQSERYAERLESIRSMFNVIEDHRFEGTARHLLVFNSESEERQNQ